MLITAVCPRCLTKYQVQETLRGKQMRCPAVSCKHVFIVGAPPTEPPSSSLPAPAEPPRPRRGTTQLFGNVGDLVPLLPLDDPEPPRPETMHVSDVLELVESVESDSLPALEPIVEPAPSSVRPDWRAAPPPVRRGTPEPIAEKPPSLPPERKKKVDTARIVVPVKEPPASSREASQKSWAPPPVRRAPPAAEERGTAPAPPPSPPSRTQLETTVEEGEPEATFDYEPVPPPRGRWAKWVILPLALATVVGLGIGSYLVYLSFVKNEEQLEKEADVQYERGLFRDARDRYDTLCKNYEASDRLPFYKFRRELSDVRHRVSEKPESPSELLDHIDQLIKDYKKDPLIIQHGADIGETLIKLLLEYCEGVAEPTDESPLKILTCAEARWSRKPRESSCPRARKTPSGRSSTAPSGKCASTSPACKGARPCSRAWR